MPHMRNMACTRWSGDETNLFGECSPEKGFDVTGLQS